MVGQNFDMLALLNGEIDAAEAMTYNEYAQVLEAVNPDTGELYQPEDLNVINFNDVGTAMLQDAVWVNAEWIAEEGNEDVATRFLKATFRGWIHCLDAFDECVDVVLDNGSTLGQSHQAWQLNEILALIFPATGFYYNTAVIDADGTYLGKYRKTHIPHVKRLWEKLLQPEDACSRCSSTTVGRIGVYICPDGTSPKAGGPWG